MKRKGMRSIFMYGGINNLINTLMIFVTEQLGQNHVEIRSLRVVRVSRQIYCRISYAGNWELVKSIEGKKFRRNHVCLKSQVGIGP